MLWRAGLPAGARGRSGVAGRSARAHRGRGIIRLPRRRGAWSKPACPAFGPRPTAWC